MNNEKKKIKFGWKEILLCLVIAAVITLFVIVFTGNTTTVIFNSKGGEFDESSGAKVYDVYDNQSALYYEELTKEYRISSVATLPEPTREGYNFVGWVCNLRYNQETYEVEYDEFTAKDIKNLEKDGEITVYAKWELITESTGENDIGKNVLSALDITWKGMLGIFLVITIIFVCIVLLNVLTNKEKRTQIANKIKGAFSKKSK